MGDTWHLHELFVTIQGRPQVLALPANADEELVLVPRVAHRPRSMPKPPSVGEPKSVNQCRMVSYEKVNTALREETSRKLRLKR